MEITSGTALYGVMGYPIGHSYSPAMHNAAFQYHGIDAVFLAFDIEPRNLQIALRGVKALGVRGLSITIPHKESILPYLDVVDSYATKIGAVNTVKNEKGGLNGYNTDGVGALGALKTLGIDITSLRAMILGSGGAARAIGTAFLPHVDSLVILNRTVSKAKSLAEELRRESNKPVEWASLTSKALEKWLKKVDLLINATSLGMFPHVNENPVPKECLRSDMIVFDTVYNPQETLLLREAKEKGARTVDGLGMLLFQGAKAFEIWTGKEAPITVMADALRRMSRR